MLLSLAWLQAGRHQKKQIALAIFTALIIALILDKTGAKLYYDPRPFMTQNVTPLVAHAADNGFPSQHTLYSVTLAVTLIFYRKKLGWIALGIALAVGIARVAALVHSPIDIIGGALFGAAAGSAGYWLSKKILSRPQA